MDEIDSIDTPQNYLVGKDKDGLPVFLGKDEPNNPPTSPKPSCDHRECSHMQCPVCSEYFDYLVGEDINGGLRACEAHWRRPTR